MKKKMTVEERKARKKALCKSRRDRNVNANGVKKVTIHSITHKIFFKYHRRMLGYEIHHPFGWEDPEKFIYIPRSLNLQIHELMRKKNLSESKNHWNEIRDLVNSCPFYTYIRC